MAPTSLLKNYQDFLRANADLQRAEKEKAYLYSDLIHYGLPFGARAKFFREHKKELVGLDKTGILALVKVFWRQPSFEERILATDILVQHADQLDSTDLPLIEKMMRECRGWALLDNLIIPVMPKIIEKDRKARFCLEKWIQDDDFWVRRSALLAQLLFFRRGVGGDKALFFKLAVSQFDERWIDEEYSETLQRKRARFFIRKAIGWVLREMSIKNPSAVRHFIKEYRTQMSGLTYREASRKLPQ